MLSQNKVIISSSKMYLPYNLFRNALGNNDLSGVSGEFHIADVPLAYVFTTKTVLVEYYSSVASYRVYVYNLLVLG